MSEDKSDNRDSGQGERKISGGRRIAEWVTLLVSLSLILGLAGYVVWQGLQPDPKFLNLSVKPLPELIEKRGESFVLPVQVENPTRRTLSELTVEVTSESGEQETREITLTFVGARSRQTVFVYFERDPRRGKLEAKPIYYRLN